MLEEMQPLAKRIRMLMWTLVDDWTGLYPIDMREMLLTVVLSMRMIAADSNRKWTVVQGRHMDEDRTRSNGHFIWAKKQR